MKKGNNVKVISLDYLTDSETEELIKRPKKFIGKQGKIKDIHLGVFKVEFENEEQEFFDGSELEVAESLKPYKVDMVFVS